MSVTQSSRHFTASMMVFDPDRGLVLLVGHKLTGFRQFPGGHVDPDETADECALREVEEETGIRPTLWVDPFEHNPIPGGNRLPTPLMVCEFPAPADPDPAWLEPAHHHIDYLYVGTADSQTQTRIQPDEIDAAVWVPVEQLGAQGIRPDVAEAARIGWMALATRAWLIESI